MDDQDIENAEIETDAKKEAVKVIQNQIDFNDPYLSGSEAVEKNLEKQNAGQE